VLVRTAQLEVANKELEAFAYSVSHDLRSPLRSIDGFSLALFEDCIDKLDDQEKDYLMRIRNATQRMARLIDDLLKLSRVTRGEMTHDVVSLSVIVRTIADSIRKQDPERAADFIIADDLKVSGDTHLLTIALENLLTNAWKFTKKSPRTVIEFGVARVNAQTAYFVRDNGIGFNMTFASKLFTPFQRLHRESEFPGTGIGLATVKRIINRHGGRVWIEGEENKGTTVYFTL
jgi:light-regulated signal transduction histidine kinase (bacteriophytochrome)